MKLFAFHTQAAHPIVISSQTVILSQVPVNAFGKSPFTIATRHRRAWLQKQFIKLFRCQRTHLALAISFSTYLSPHSHILLLVFKVLCRLSLQFSHLKRLLLFALVSATFAAVDISSCSCCCYCLLYNSCHCCC